MKSWRFGSGIATIALSALSFSALASEHRLEFRPNEVIVKYKDGVTRNRNTMNEIYDKLGVVSVMRYSSLMEGFEHLLLNDSVSVEKAVTELRKNSMVEFAQPNYIVHALPLHAPVTASTAPMQDSGTPCFFPGLPFPPGCTDNGSSDPNPAPTPPPSSGDARPVLRDAPAEMDPPQADPEISKLYGMAKIGAIQSWERFHGTKKFIVADIDTGIDYNHEDLAFNVWRNPNPSDKQDITGYDFIHNDGLPYDDNMHGTHTAGIIGAVGGNGIGIAGVDPLVSIMAVKFLSGSGEGDTATAIKAIDYAVVHGAKVLSNSWGGPGDNGNDALKAAIDRAQASDVLFVAAAGNDGKDNDDSSQASYPAGFDNDNLISVAATDKNDEIALFSNYGLKTTHVAAPGVNVYSTIPGNKYQQESGTSMACPHVAGAVALLWSQHPDWNYKKVKQVLMSSVDKLPSLEGKTVTGGRINILKALRSTE